MWPKLFNDKKSLNFHPQKWTFDFVFFNIYYYPWGARKSTFWRYHNLISVRHRKSTNHPSCTCTCSACSFNIGLALLPFHLKTCVDKFHWKINRLPHRSNPTLCRQKWGSILLFLWFAGKLFSFSFFLSADSHWAPIYERCRF